MNNSKTCAVVFASVVVSSVATMAYVQPSAYQAGYDQAHALANWVMAPTTLEEAAAEKRRCEKITNETCWISGRYYPESMTIDGSSDAPESKQNAPEAI